MRSLCVCYNLLSLSSIVLPSLLSLLFMVSLALHLCILSPCLAVAAAIYPQCLVFSPLPLTYLISSVSTALHCLVLALSCCTLASLSSLIPCDLQWCCFMLSLPSFSCAAQPRYRPPTRFSSALIRRGMLIAPQAHPQSFSEECR